MNVSELWQSFVFLNTNIKTLNRYNYYLSEIVSGVVADSDKGISTNNEAVLDKPSGIISKSNRLARIAGDAFDWTAADRL